MTVTATYEIVNALGLHARPAAKMVSAARAYRSKIYVERDGHVANAKSLMSLLTLACPQGSRLTVRAEGPDARDAVAALGKLIADRFGED